MNNTHDTILRLSERTRLLITSVDDFIMVQMVSMQSGHEIAIVETPPGAALVLREPNGDDLMVIEPGFARRIRFDGLELIEA